MEIKLGVVGLSKNGGWASFGLIPPLLSKPLSEYYALAAVSTSSAESAEATAAHYSELTKRQVKGYHGSTVSISADEDVDMLVVSVKAHEHKDAAMPAIEAGKAVFVEWPLGRNLEEARLMASTAKKNNVRTMIGTQGWFVPAFVKIKEWIDAGTIGQVTSTSWYATKDPNVRVWSPVSSPKLEYYFDEANGATFLDIVVGHHLACVMHVLGKLKTVSAAATIGHAHVTLADAPDTPDARTIPNPLPDQYAVIGELESGALFSGTWVTLTQPVAGSQPALVWTIAGTKGQIRVEQRAPPPGNVAPQMVAPEVVLLNEEVVNFKRENEGATPAGLAWAAFALGGRVPTFEDGLELHKAVEAIRRSAKEGLRIVVDEV